MEPDQDGKQFLRRFSSGGYYCMAIRQLRKHPGQVGGLQDFQEFVAGVPFQPADLAGRVEESESFLHAETDDAVTVESDRLGSVFCPRLEILRVAEMDQPLDPPEVICEIGIKEFHGPALLRRRKTAQEQDPGPGGEEGVKRMCFDEDSATGQVHPGQARSGGSVQKEYTFILQPLPLRLTAAQSVVSGDAPIGRYDPVTGDLWCKGIGMQRITDGA